MIGAVFVLLSVTGLATWLQRVFVKPVVRGIQLGIGLLLALAAVGMLARPAQLTVADGPLVSVGVVLAVAIGLTVAFCLLAFNRAGLPGGALLLLGAGAALGLAVGVHPVVDVALGPAPLILRLPSAFDFASAFWLLVVPQVGLSIGNSLVATAATARRYFGEAARGVTTRRLALTMGLANLAVSPLGGMPMCHGAGGMTAHVKTGARTGLGTGVFGAVLVVLGVALGGTAPAVVGVLPPAVLGGFLLYVGLQHVTLAADLRGWMEISVAAVVAVIAVVTGNISLGVVAGLGVCWLVSLWRSRRAAPPAPPAR
jgi:SulP family sulfate permease